MHAVLIVDAFKSSIVMTSEIIKDKLSATIIEIAKTGEECLTLVEKKPFDLIIVDFDLPDADGVSLIKLLRKTYQGPILLTAFEEKVVAEAIKTELFFYADSSAFIKKPVKFDDFSAKIDAFLLEKKRILKRYGTKVEAFLVGSGTGRGKKAPKAKGNIINIGMGGALIKMPEGVKLKVGEEVTLKFHLPTQKLAEDTIKVSKAKQSAADPKGSSNIKAKVAWTDKTKKHAGVYFDDLSEAHAKSIEVLMRHGDELD